MSKYGVFFWSVFSRIFAEYGPEKTPYLDTFHAVSFYKKVVLFVSERGAQSSSVTEQLISAENLSVFLWNTSQFFCRTYLNFFDKIFLVVLQKDS